MSRRIDCRSDGCKNEVIFKSIEAYIDPQDRRAGGVRASVSGPGRGSPNGYHRHSAAAASLYCKQHTCMHFFREEGCPNKKPQHDAVCAIHARCPVQHCNQARAQYLDAKFEPIPGAVPRYMRYELCIDHKCIVRLCDTARASPMTNFCAAHGCQAEGCTNLSQDRRNCCEKHQCQVPGCGTIVEGRYPYCVIHIKCEIKACNMARHILPRTKEYLRYCETHVTCEADHCREIKLDHSLYCANHTCHERGCGKSCYPKPYCAEHMCAEPSCEYPRPLPAKLKQKAKGKYCPLHTCREKECHEFVESLSLFCKDHGCSKQNCLHPVLAEGLCIHHFKDEYHTRGQYAARERATTREQYAKHDYYSPMRKAEDTGTGSETVTDSESDNGDHFAKEAPMPAEPATKREKRGARFKPVVTHRDKRHDAATKERADRDWQTRKGASFSSSSGGGGGDVTVGASSSSRRQQQQPLPPEKPYWIDSTRVVGSSPRESLDSLVAERGGGPAFKIGSDGIVHLNGGTTSSSTSSSKTAGGKRAVGTEEVPDNVVRA